MKKKKLFYKITAFALIPIPLIGIAAMLIYPHYNSVVLARESLDVKRAAHSVVLQLFTTISPSKALTDYEKDFGDELAMEYVSPAILAKYQNEGVVSEALQPEDTKILINSANVNANIIDGIDAFAMEKGPWHFPLSVGPGEKGNFVIIGHRFAELPPSRNTFFNLDKVKIGDKIEITKKGGIKYTYTVVDSKVVEKNDRTVLQNYGDYRITLITCTPLWTSKQRLIITGILDKAYGNI